ncbi:FapA family protein [Salinispira pacifica]
MSSSPSPGRSFRLFYRKGWAYLVVYPPKNARKTVYPEEIEGRMKLLGIPPVRAGVVRGIIERASGKPEALVEWPAGRALAATISVSIADDRMSAAVTVEAPKKGAAPPEVEDVLEELNHAGVLFGIDTARIARLLSGREYGTPIEVAAGREPVFGRGHRIVYHFNTNRGKPYLEMDFGRINLKELNFIENCVVGDLLATLEPPVRPVDGRTVTGEVIPAEVDNRVVELKPGPNTHLSSDRTKLFAQRDGNVKLNGDVVLVEPVVTVPHVNYETGNIHFDGSVVVEGGIADGFVVEAEGNIQVGKGVGRATLKAGGNILLKTGITGNNEGTIDCRGDLFAKYIESSTVTCRGNILVEEAIMHSNVTSFRHCVLNGRRSEVIASTLIVGGSFWCKKLGNIYETATHVSVGVEPGLLLTYRSTMSNVEAKQQEWDKADHQLSQLARMIQEGRSDERLAAAKSQLEATLSHLTAEIAELRRRVPPLRERLRASRSSVAVIEEVMYKGAVVTFGSLEYRAPDKGARKTILKAGEHEITESGYNYRDRPKLNFEEPAAELEEIEGEASEGAVPSQPAGEDPGGTDERRAADT